MKICAVCDSETSKYKCPQCNSPYCSLICYKTHKESCVKIEKIPQTQQVNTADVKYNQIENYENVRLQKIKQSPEFCKFLQDKEAQDLLTKLSQVKDEDQKKEWEQQKNNPLFQKFLQLLNQTS